MWCRVSAGSSPSSRKGATLAGEALHTVLHGTETSTPGDASASRWRSGRLAAAASQDAVRDDHVESCQRVVPVRWLSRRCRSACGDARRRARRAAAQDLRAPVVAGAEPRSRLFEAGTHRAALARHVRRGSQPLVPDLDAAQGPRPRGCGVDRHGAQAWIPVLRRRVGERRPGHRDREPGHRRRCHVERGRAARDSRCRVGARRASTADGPARSARGGPGDSRRGRDARGAEKAAAAVNRSRLLGGHGTDGVSGQRDGAEPVTGRHSGCLRLERPRAGQLRHLRQAGRGWNADPAHEESPAR